MGLGLQRLNFIRALSQREAASYSIDTGRFYLSGSSLSCIFHNFFVVNTNMY